MSCTNVLLSKGLFQIRAMPVGDCDVTENNYIGYKDATSEFGCFIQCAITEDCNYYNWFTDLYLRDACVLFSSCDTVSPCSYHGVHISWHIIIVHVFLLKLWRNHCSYRNKQYII